MFSEYHGHCSIDQKYVIMLLGAHQEFINTLGFNEITLPTQGSDRTLKAILSVISHFTH